MKHDDLCELGNKFSSITSSSCRCASRAYGKDPLPEVLPPLEPAMTERPTYMPNGMQIIPTRWFPLTGPDQDERQLRAAMAYIWNTYGPHSRFR